MPAVAGILLALTRPPEEEMLEMEVDLSQLSQQQREVVMASNAMDATLLITGSTGTGKSHLAAVVHSISPRRRLARFYKINLATLSENLIESELFGHERGAFTGADVKRTGRLETCNGGTVFLDEIGELSPRLQAKLLDFIQYKKITPVGSNRETEVDVRIIAATNKNLELCVKNGDFRADLYHRLNVFQVHLTDLCLTPKAILPMAREFLRKIGELKGRPFLKFSKEAEAALRHYRWPGNIRELEHAIEYCIGMEPGREIQLRSLPMCFQNLKTEFESSCVKDEEFDELHTHELKVPKSIGRDAIGMLQLPINLNFHETKESFEKIYLEHALRLCGGQINLTSRRIGLNKVSLTEKIKRYAIDWRKIRFHEENSHNTSSNLEH